LLCWVNGRKRVEGGGAAISFVLDVFGPHCIRMYNSDFAFDFACRIE
jgi:hypothetical protein